jgi:hypothetical protein
MERILSHCPDNFVMTSFKRQGQQSERAGLDPQIVEKISGHSMRVGAAKPQVSEGASLPLLMTKGRWTKVDTVMRYVEQIA